MMHETWCYTCGTTARPTCTGDDHTNVHEDTLAAVQQVRDNASQMTYVRGPGEDSSNIERVLIHHLDAIEKIVKLHRKYMHSIEPNLGLEE